MMPGQILKELRQNQREKQQQKPAKKRRAQRSRGIGTVTGKEAPDPEVRKLQRPPPGVSPAVTLAEAGEAEPVSGFPAGLPVTVITKRPARSRPAISMISATF